MFGFKSWLRSLFGSKAITAAVRQVDAEVDAFIDERFTQVVDRMKARIQLRLADLQREPAVDAEWEPVAKQLTHVEPAAKPAVQRRKSRKPVAKVAKRGRKAKRAA